MLAEFLMFIQLFGMAVLAAILPTIVIMFAIYLAYVYRENVKHFIRIAMRLIKWLVMMAFGEPEAAQHVTKTWRNKHAN